MTDNEMRIAIAEACGWKFLGKEGMGWCEAPNGSPILECNIPDYPNDLNAMHEAEKTFHWEPDNEHCQAQEYYEHLVFICGRGLPKGKPFGYLCHVCGEQIYDNQAVEHSEAGLIHTECPQADCYDWHLVTATARQRAEAFLKTIGKWKE